MIKLRGILLKTRNVSDINGGENQNTYFMSNNLFSENRADYEATDENTIRRMRTACRITMATKTRS